MRRLTERAGAARGRRTGGRRRRVPALSRRRLRRLGLVMAGIAVLAVGGTLAMRDGAATADSRGFDRMVYDWTADVGLSVQEVLVYGREATQPIELLAALGVGRGDPILMLDPAAARDRIESLPWVREAWVQRRLPDTVLIRIEERRPLALWQNEQRLTLIDDEGEVLGEGEIAAFAGLPQVVGVDTPDHAPQFLPMLAAEPEVADRVSAAVRVGGRRWDLRLDNGVAVRLPEEDVPRALHSLARLQREEGLFDRDVVAIDLRIAGHLVIRTSTEVHERMRLPEENT